jgi:hypothetical protein
VVDISSIGHLDDLELVFSLQECRGTRYKDFIEAERQALRTELKDIKTCFGAFLSGLPGMWTRSRSLWG